MLGTNQVVVVSLRGASEGTSGRVVARDLSISQHAGRVRVTVKQPRPGFGVVVRPVARARVAVRRVSDTRSMGRERTPKRTPQPGKMWVPENLTASIPEILAGPDG